MSKLTTSRNLYNLTKIQILDKIENGNIDIDKFLLDTIVSDFICFKIFAEFDQNMNNIIKHFLTRNNIEHKDKEIGVFKPSEIRKYLIRKFKIPKNKLDFLRNRTNFTDFIINRHSIGHTAASSSISFAQAEKYLDEGDEILENVNETLKIYGKISNLQKKYNLWKCFVSKVKKRFK